MSKALERELKSTLEESIQRWVEQENPNRLFDAQLGEETEYWMAQAAWSALAAIAEAQKYNLREGNLAKPTVEGDE